MANPYVENLNRLEFVVTMACTGRCRHCSEGDHAAGGPSIDPDTAARVVRAVAVRYALRSVMTFGGEALLRPETVYAAHAAARDAGVPRRQLITNGFFSRDEAVIRRTAAELYSCGVNDLLLSADAFHQEFIPLEPVLTFARALLEAGVPFRMSPAWLVSPADDNPWNRRTEAILDRFRALGVTAWEGNVIFPEGNALRYLGDYFDPGRPVANPYEEDPRDLRAVSVGCDGEVLGRNLRDADILDILEDYRP